MMYTLYRIRQVETKLCTRTCSVACLFVVTGYRKLDTGECGWEPIEKACAHSCLIDPV